MTDTDTIHDTRNPYASIIRDLMQKRGLISTFDLIPGFDATQA